MGCSSSRSLSVDLPDRRPQPFPELPCEVRRHERAAEQLLLAAIAKCTDPPFSSHLPGSSARVRRLIRTSLRSCPAIPQAYRWWAWQHLSGGCELHADAPWLYRTLLLRGTAPADLTIRHDAHRTFPEIPFFGPSSRAGPGQSQLYRILTAYSHLDTELGYTQGLNFVAALLLLAGLSEDAAFYAFASLLLRCGLRRFYTPGLPLAMEAHATLARLLQHGWPSLASHLEEGGVPPQLYSTQWLLSGFVSSPLPPSTALVIFDRLFIEARLGPLPPAVVARIAELEPLSLLHNGNAIAPSTHPSSASAFPSFLASPTHRAASWRGTGIIGAALAAGADKQGGRVTSASSTTAEERSVHGGTRAGAGSAAATVAGNEQQ